MKIDSIKRGEFLFVLVAETCDYCIFVAIIAAAVVVFVECNGDENKRKKKVDKKRCDVIIFKSKQNKCRSLLCTLIRLIV